MSEIRCPMCGKPNPDYLDVCQFCEARLKPLTASLPSDAVPSDGTTPEQPENSSDLPDWLDFSSDSQFEDEDQAADDDEAPFDDDNDWMSRLDSDLESQESFTFQPGAEPDDEQHAAARMDFDNDGLPDWMEDLEKTRSTPPLEQPEEAVEGEFPTWLTADEESDKSSKLPDWLIDSASKDIDADSLPTAENDLPNWLAGKDDDAIESALPDSEGDLPDWLSELSSEESAEPEEAILSQLSTPAFAGDDADELPDWLNDQDNSLDDDESLPAAAEGDLPDWLSELSSEETAEPEEAILSQASTPAFAGDDVDVLPDWLNDQDDSLDNDESLPEAAEGNLPDWLSELSSEETAEPEEAIVPQASTPAFIAEDEEEVPDLPSGEKDGEFESQDDDGLPAWLTSGGTEENDEEELPDWFSDLGGEEIPEIEEPTSIEEPIVPVEVPPTRVTSVPAFSTDVDEEPDWFADDDFSDGTDEPIYQAAEGDLPKWLSDLSDDETALPEEAISDHDSDKAAAPDELYDQDAASSFTPDTSSTGVTDWLTGGEVDEVKTVLSAAESDLPDWLIGEDEEEEEGTFTVEESDLPDWISNLGGDEISAPEEAIPTDQAEDLPEWLRGQAEDQAESALPTEESDLPDWLMSEVEKEAESTSPAEQSDLPDWISDLGGDEISTPEEAIPIDQTEDLPEWLRGQAEDKAESALPVEESDLPDWLSDFDAEKISGDDIAETAILTTAAIDELPEWLSDVDGIEEEPSQENLSETESDDFDESRAVPDWLGDIDGGPIGGVVGDTPLGDEQVADLTEDVVYDLEDAFEDDLNEFEQLPEWLSGSSISDVDQVQAISSDDENIAQAELPGWLAAMRPVESATSKTIDVDRSGPVENSGPLAGLYSVLAAQPEIIQIKKPPVYSNKLQVSEAQQTHAALLGEMIQGEGISQALPLPPKISSHRVFRLILGIMLLAIAFIAVFVGGEMIAMPAPEVIPAGVEQTYQIISGLSQEDTVLISFDFEPGLVGEMDATSAALVDNIMEKGAKLALVSTSPTGPALAERFVSDVQENHQYISGNQYVNLGYIPGGVSGLAAFAQNPNWSTPTTLDGDQAWETQPLINIKSVSDFALVLLITDNPNTTRAWVEQVNPYLGPVPLVAAVSAQVEPVARAYFGQIDGLISGLTGGAAYEVMGGTNLARAQWDAFNIILIVTVSAMLIGGSISIGSTMIARQKENGGESA